MPESVMLTLYDTQAFLLFCASQAFLHRRQSRQGEIALR